MPTSRPTLLLVAGLCVTVLTFGLPLAHLGARLPGSGLALALLPVVTLLMCWLWPAAPVLTHFVFPVSHLPLLLAQPGLASREVYGGASGLLGLVAIASAFATFLVAATPALRPPKRSTPLTAHPDLWRGLAVVVAVGPILALGLPALTTVDADPLGAAFAIGAGLAVSVVAVGLWMPRLILALPSHTRATATRQPLAPEAETRLRALARESRPSGARTTWVLVSVALALGGVLAWTTWRP